MSAATTSTKGLPMRTSHLLLAAAVSGLLAGGFANAEDVKPIPKDDTKAEKNACKAKDGCKAADKSEKKDGKDCAACETCEDKDKNACKAKDGCKAEDKKVEGADKDKNACKGKDGCGAKK